LNFRNPTFLTVFGIGATLVVTAAVIVVLLQFGGGAKAVSDNAALIGALVALGGVFTSQMVNSALEAQRARQARNTERAQRKRELDTEQAQRKRELEVRSQQAQDDATQAFLDEMTRLLLDRDKPLRLSREGDEVRTLARARTLTVLSRLDGARKGNVVQFLYESNLMMKDHGVVNLRGADLSRADLSEAGLSRADLSGADLTYADLSDARLSYADLTDAILNWANLGGAKGANLGYADLSKADLSGADLSKADLTYAVLSYADLRDANLFRAGLERVMNSIRNGLGMRESEIARGPSRP
jgi:uncharacterized protein YjbI with pentapeptide repeats